MPETSQYTWNELSWVQARYGWVSRRKLEDGGETLIAARACRLLETSPP